MTLKHKQPGSSRSEPIASTSIALRKRSRASGLIRTFTHSASMSPPFLRHEPPPDLCEGWSGRHPQMPISALSLCRDGETPAASLGEERRMPAQLTELKVRDVQVRLHRAGHV